jgi:hypothetical protein
MQHRAQGLPSLRINTLHGHVDSPFSERVRGGCRLCGIQS